MNAALQGRGSDRERRSVAALRTEPGVIRTTIGGRVLDCNQATASMLGYHLPEQVLTLPAGDLYYCASDREAFLTKIRSESRAAQTPMARPEVKKKHRDRPDPVLSPVFSSQTRRSSSTSCEETKIEIDFQKKCRKVQFFTRFRGFEANCFNHSRTSPRRNKDQRSVNSISFGTG
jgi:PAS domain-containing protein